MRDRGDDLAGAMSAMSIDGEGKSKSLHLAAASGNLADLQTLLAMGVDVNTPDKFGVTALHKAARAGHLNIITELCTAGANPNALDNAKNTPLHVAAGPGHLDVVKELLAKGAHPKTRNSLGQTAWDKAQSLHPDVASLLQENAGDNAKRICEEGEEGKETPPQAGDTKRPRKEEASEASPDGWEQFGKAMAGVDYWKEYVQKMTAVADAPIGSALNLRKRAATPPPGVEKRGHAK